MDLGKHGGPADGQDAVVEILGDGVAEVEFDASHFHGREKFSVGKLGQAFGLAADAGKFLDVVVPRRDVRIADGPIHADGPGVTARE